MDDPEIWRWIWLAAAVLLGIGELATGGLFLLPFALAAVAALLLSLVGFPLLVQMTAFVVVAVATVAAFRPLARRSREGGTVDGIGASRLTGRHALVLSAIGHDDAGEIRVDAEEWRAVSADGSPIPAGVEVTIVEMRGTRAVVRPLTEIDPVPEIGD